MTYKKFSTDLITLQEKLRHIVLQLAFNFDLTKAKKNIASEKAIEEVFEQIFKIVKSPSEELFFQNYQHMTDVLMHLMKWVQKKFDGVSGSDANLEAAKIRINLFDVEGVQYTPAFIQSILQFKQQLAELSNIDQLKNLLMILTATPFPYLYTVASNPYGIPFIPRDDHEEEEKQNIVLSIEFLINNEPWANPQILKPQLLYKIEGKLQINEWPKGYTKLVLQPISAQDSSLYKLIIPEITDTKKNEFQISGNVLFKYPQHSFEDFTVIKLLAFFVKENGERFFPTMIGYDQLIAKAVDPNLMPFLTGFNAMNNEVFNIASNLSKELPDLDSTEKTDFLLLLSGILNYMGFCLQQGIYKGVSDIKENDFRDKLIQHLIGLPYLGENISKEAHLAGGRIEVGYKGLIAELKIEKKITDRKVLIDTYCHQPVAYASGNSKQLSILCILDLTEKKSPSAHAQNNIVMVTPTVHGFDEKDLSHPSKVAVVIIDGNTVNPSSYSK